MKSVKALRIGVIALAAASLLLSIALLWSVRTSYSGPAYDGVELISVDRVKTSLPTFSDEWVIAGYVQKSVERDRLPDFHPLDDSLRPAENPLVVLLTAFAFVSKYAKLDMVTDFSVFVFLFQAAFVLAFFLCMRACNVSVFSSVVGVVALLFFPESNIMQGIWIMLPAYIGAIFLMLAFVSLSDADTRRSRFWPACLLFVAGIVYPPYLIIAILFFAVSFIIRPRIRQLIAYASVLLAGAFLFVVLMKVEISASNVPLLFDSFLRIAFHERFGVSTASTWGYMPIAFYVMGLLGAYAWFANSDDTMCKKRKTALASCIAILVALSLLGPAFDVDIILGYQRVIFLSWLVLVMMAGFALDRILGWLARMRPFNRGLSAHAWTVSALCVIVAFQSLLVWSGAYPKFVPWEGVATRQGIFVKSISALPVMKRMLPDDFEDRISLSVSGAGDDRTARLLAPPYVALAIAASTDMAPVSTVDSIVSVQGPSYLDFEKLGTCEARRDFTRKAQATHVLVHVSHAGMVDGCDSFRSVMSIGDRYHMYSVK